MPESPSFKPEDVRFSAPDLSSDIALPASEADTEEAIDRRLDVIALTASEQPGFVEAVANAANRIEALKVIRLMLAEQFPEIANLPEPQPKGGQEPIMGLASHDYAVAKRIFELLWDK